MTVSGNEPIFFLQMIKRSLHFIRSKEYATVLKNSTQSQPGKVTLKMELGLNKFK